MIYRNTQNRSRNHSIDERISFERLWRGAMQTLGDGRHLRPLRPQYEQLPTSTSRIVLPATGSTCCCHCNCFGTPAAMQPPPAIVTNSFFKGIRENPSECLSVRLYNDGKHGRVLRQCGGREQQNHPHQALRSVVRLVIL